ncbi:MAG: aminodeoxychorismate synthase component I [Gammaproteobacteria bacterium]
MKTATAIAQLPYHTDSSVLFERIADRPWAVFLDSGRPHCSQGRYDIMACDPAATLVTHGQHTMVRTAEGSFVSGADPFDLLRRQLGARTQGVEQMPFCGGAIGYFGYDLARRLERLPTISEDAEHLPEMAVGLYDWAVVVDHEHRRTQLVWHGTAAPTAARRAELVARFTGPADPVERTPFRTLEPMKSNMTAAEYARAFQRIATYIREGDCYQVNLAQRFAAGAEGDAWLAYQRLRTINPAPFGAYLSTPQVKVLSASPERFLQVRGERVCTRPIKGTRPRSADPAMDRSAAEALHNSPKDRAENLMIVDLLRNDLGKCCMPGSVQVPELFRLESFATVHHLVSTVTGTLAGDRDGIDVLRACFPGGSITGAPKLRAMEIIEELEPQRRGIYCGAIGYVSADGTLDTSITIRTLVYADGILRFWAGGGIVADSVLDDEYQETYHKAAALLQLSEMFREAGSAPEHQ